ncbi:bacteriohopanetetrol glucosamine biosynthesis glycosyltransferase HpnI [Sphingomonas immobilis]|uniref:Bacteriohopanetetrol glucosamine biosynthesis glycosyltransferase HpnI n=1 Tax=Sphingomonas immobilis TaxID=3063997 RepID=A0ABT8ZZP6_9SPHN|nr:bacteriohopanetetrol glucosamine biosynthesis glycosyltransferase HpnI [Sphingomonas sp. CA1-15]MDO7843055.1 bacteriohopanetetrol glucosamine biosynthesis glycosyltransferase HpnI [Sphingomonas sp. CA1-15]
MSGIGAILSWAATVLACMAFGYTVASLIVFLLFFQRRSAIASAPGAVTILKPLHGAEPQLETNLVSFLTQDYAAPVQLLCGVQRANDPAIAVVESLRRRFPEADIELVVDGARHGSNGKVSNLINMAPRIRHDVTLLSDSDIFVEPDYVRRVLAALQAPGVGAVSCAYYGRGDAGIWSRLGAAGISYQFLLNLTFGVYTGLAKPCMGSTIALRRGEIEALEGFRTLADVLADDYAIGAAIRATGRDVVVPSMLVGHAFDERSLAGLWRHELRWAATVRGTGLARYMGTVICMPLPLALIACVFAPLPGFGLTLAALLVRIAVVLTVDRKVGEAAAPLWMLPLRDIMSFAVYVASFFVRSVDWRGAELKIDHHGQLVRPPEIS